MKLTRWVTYITLALLQASTASAYADNGNSHFAREVQNHLAEMKRDKSKLEEAKALCRNLPQSKIENDSRCVAMQKYFSEQLLEGKFTPSPPKSW